MCGITGKIQFHIPIDAEKFQRQCNTLRHRGPDDSGIWFSSDQQVALGSRRLAIQDLSAAGHMPMSDSSGKVRIVFNGEIYNFQSLRKGLETKGQAFRSGTDTEVIIAAYLQWGVDCLSHLNGMFAFAIADFRNSGHEHLFLARDRAGEKPIYYWHHTNGFSFASELKALMADFEMPRRLDVFAFDAYLEFGYVPDDMCILEGVKKLPPAHAMLYEIGKRQMNIWRYWRLPEFHDVQEAEANVLVEELENLLKKSVRERLVADVPVGILLSGGLDSGLITAMAARISDQPVKTFTISFPGHGKYDETVYARQVADYFSTDHHELVAEPASVELLPQLAEYYDEPLADSSLVPTYLVSRLTREHVTVALGGDGGDELFGGYGHYSTAASHERLRKFIPSPIRHTVADMVSHLPIGLKGRNYFLTLMADRKTAYRNSSYFDLHPRRKLLSAPIANELRGKINEVNECRNNANIVDYLTRLDFTTYLPDDILSKVDRASMAVSLELRAPFLDQHIVEFAFGRIPAYLKANSVKRKILPRLLAKKLLPPALDINRKQGFSLPLDSWLKSEWGAFVKEIFSDADENIFSQNEMKKLLANQRRGFSNTSRIFAITMFELWRREYKIEVRSNE